MEPSPPSSWGTPQESSSSSGSGEYSTVEDSDSAAIRGSDNAAPSPSDEGHTSGPSVMSGLKASIHAPGGNTQTTASGPISVNNNESMDTSSDVSSPEVSAPEATRQDYTSLPLNLSRNGVSFDQALSEREASIQSKPKKGKNTKAGKTKGSKGSKTSTAGASAATRKSRRVIDKAANVELPNDADIPLANFEDVESDRTNQESFEAIIAQAKKQVADTAAKEAQLALPARRSQYDFNGLTTTRTNETVETSSLPALDMRSDHSFHPSTAGSSELTSVVTFSSGRDKMKPVKISRKRRHSEAVPS